MARHIIPTQHPSIRQIAIEGELTYDDMTCEAELDLDKGVPIWVILDVASMNVTLPDHFLDGARQSFFLNPNLQHLAIYCQSAFLRTVAFMVAKLTRRQEKLSVHDSLDKAMAHIQTLIKRPEK